MAREGEQDRHVENGEKHDYASKKPNDRGRKSTQIESEEAPAFRLFISDVQSGHHGLRECIGAPKSQAQADRKTPAECSARRRGDSVDVIDHHLIGLGWKDGTKHAKVLLHGRGIRRQTIERDQRR